MRISDIQTLEAIGYRLISTQPDRTLGAEFQRALLQVADRAVAIQDVNTLDKLHEIVGRIYLAIPDDGCGINTLDLGEYLSLAADALRAGYAAEDFDDYLREYRATL